MAAQQCDDTLFRLSGRNDKQNRSVNLTLDRLHDSERRAEGAAAATELNPCSSPVSQSCEENEKQVGRQKAAAAAAARRRCRVDARQQEDFQITIVINCKKKKQQGKKRTVLCRVFGSLPSHFHQAQKKVSKLGKCWEKLHTHLEARSPVSSVFFCGF